MGFNFSIGYRSTKPGSPLGAMFFFGLFLAAGIGLGWALGKQKLQENQVPRWPVVGMTVAYSSINEEVLPFENRIAVEYDYGGHHSSWVRKDSPEGLGLKHEDYREAVLQQRQFAMGSAITGYVNPDNPAEVVLQPPSHWGALQLVIPGIFAGVGFLGVRANWRRFRKHAKSEAAGDLPGRVRRILALIMGILFFGVGLLMVGKLSWPTFREWRAAQNWRPTPCVVERYGTLISHDSKSTTSKPSILYAYRWGEEIYKSNRWKLLDVSTNLPDFADTQNRYRPGRQISCYVNPLDPTVAVLDRTLGWRGCFCYSLSHLSSLGRV